MLFFQKVLFKIKEILEVSGYEILNIIGQLSNVNINYTRQKLS
jgi:hypothetical protein